MWARGRKELTALNVNPDLWIGTWEERIKRGDAVAFDTHAILGCDFESPGVINTSFQASTSFEQEGVGSEVSKELRRHIPKLMQERGIRLVCTYSLCVDPRSAEWFRLLGLTEDTNFRGAKHGEYVARRFVRRA